MKFNKVSVPNACDSAGRFLSLVVFQTMFKPKALRMQIYEHALDMKKAELEKDMSLKKFEIDLKADIF